MLRRITRNSHVYDIRSKTSKAEQWIFAAPDMHWDNPKCKRDLLKRHLDEAVAKGARIIMPGDTFCLMQGAYDPRKVKSDVRPEHNVANYIDAVIEDAAEWFAPYQSHIDVIGQGNHETNILKRLETDVLQRFVALLNQKAKGEHRVQVGGYGGWYTLAFEMNRTRKSWTMKYYHGSGGGAQVTKGSIEHHRHAVQVEGADCILMGHVHNDYEITESRESLDDAFKPVKRDVMMVRAGTYKDEHVDGYGGWHVEKGLGPRPMGGRFISVNFERGRAAETERGVKAKPTTITAFSHRAV